MTTRRLGLIMHGVTGRMGMNQHLIRSIVAIREQGGVQLSNGDRVMPDPILIGRNADKIEVLVFPTPGFPQKRIEFASSGSPTPEMRRCQAL